MHAVNWYETCLNIDSSIFTVGHDEKYMQRNYLIKKLLWITGVVVMTIIAASHFQKFYTLKEAEDVKREKLALRVTYQAKQQLEAQLAKVQTHAESLAQRLSTQQMTDTELWSSLEYMLQQETWFYGGAVAFAPYQFKSSQRLYAPYLFKSQPEEPLKRLYIEQAYDYTDIEQSWFVEAIAKGSRWSEPYYDESLGNILMVTYSAVFYDSNNVNKRSPIGVVTIDLAIESLAQSLQVENIAHDGYLELISSKGTYLYSPALNKVSSQKNIFVDSKLTSEDSLWLKQNLYQKQTSISRSERIPSKNIWQAISPLTIGWSIYSVFIYDSAHIEHQQFKRHLMFALLFFFIAISLVCLSGISLGAPFKTWIVFIITYCVVTFCALFAIWNIHFLYGDVPNPKSQLVLNQTSLQTIKNNIKNDDRGKLKESTQFSSVGIQIESIKFLNPNEIFISGNLWQLLTQEQLKTISPGVHIVGATHFDASLMSKQHTSRGKLFLWSFRLQKQFNIDYYHYPLIRENLEFSMTSSSMPSLQLLPDIDAYFLIQPSDLPGLDTEAFLAGWSMEKSYFDVRAKPINTTLGFKKNINTTVRDPVYFNIQIVRNYWNPFISYLTPLLIAFIIACLVLSISSNDSDDLMLLRTGVGFELGICASILFVVALTHIGIRKNLDSQHVFYLEYFFFLMYFNLLWLCIFSILHAQVAQQPTRAKKYHEIKHWFAPTNLLIVFIFTWLVFHD